jgi:hypothetical protein
MNVFIHSENYGTTRGKHLRGTLTPLLSIEAEREAREGITHAVSTHQTRL